jgi:hypothetical protein
MTNFDTVRRCNEWSNMISAVEEQEKNNELSNLFKTVNRVTGKDKGTIVKGAIDD